MSVWVLVFYVAGFRAGGPAVIDNISTVQECQRVLSVLEETYGRGTDIRGRCIEVRKARP